MFLYLSTILLAFAAMACPASSIGIGKLDTKQLVKRATAQDFFIDGKHIPGIPFAINDSYAGLLPVSSKDHSGQSLFFWLHPAATTLGKEDLVIWLNGGPGCSSMVGLFLEHGPVLFSKIDATQPPNINPYSWHLLSNVLYVDQPIGTGLSTGTPDITNEEQLAVEFYGFLQQFFTAFPDYKGKRLWISGESYAGRYIPYIASHILFQGNDKNLASGINYQGFLLGDPYFVNNSFGIQMPAVEFARQHQSVMKLNSSFMASLDQYAKANGAYMFVKKNLKYPPNGPIQLPVQLSSDYDAQSRIIDAFAQENKCPNINNVADQCPNVDSDQILIDFINNSTNGFKQYIHANPSQEFYECSNVFPYSSDENPLGIDSSPPPANTKILQHIIEQSPAQRSMIVHGQLDFNVLAEGTALALQNTTWNGLQGFQQPPTKPLIVNGKNEGVIQSERGLTFVRVKSAGHMVPFDAPWVSFRLQQYWLGQISLEDLSH